MPKLDPEADPALAEERSFNSVQLVPLNTSVFPVAGDGPGVTNTVEEWTSDNALSTVTVS